MTNKEALRKLHLAAENTAIGAFKDMGFSVTRVPTSDEHRTADLVIDKGEERHTVEVTTKTDSGDFEAALKAGKMAEECRIEQHNSTIQRVIRGKKQQVRATGTGGFGVLWIETLGTFGPDLAEEVIATFFGSVSVPERQADGRNLEKRGFFHDKAECFAHPQLNGVIVCNAGGARLLVNPEAADVAAFRKSSLVTTFGEAIIDPDADVERKVGFTLRDYRGPRAPTPENDRARRKFLGDKYGFAVPIAFRMRRMTIATRIPVDVLAERLAAAQAKESIDKEAP